MRRRSDTANLALCALLTALTVVGAFLKITVGHVPVTLQTLFVYLSGNLMTPGYAAATQLTYLLCGLVGLPVFSSGGGPGSVLLPTFGYLLAFPITSFTISKLLQKYNDTASLARLVLANAVGASIVFALGVVYLYINLNLISGIGISVKAALWSGVFIMLPGEIVKVVAAAVLADKLYRHL